MKQQYAYQWSDQRNAYRIYDVRSGATIAYRDNVDDARAYVTKLTGKR